MEHLEKYPAHQNNYSSEKNDTAFFSKTNNNPIQAKEEGAFFQTKLTVGEPNDQYEKEADAVANTVVDSSSTTPVIQEKEISSIQRTSLATPQEDEKLATAEQRTERDKLIQEKSDASENEEEMSAVQRKATTNSPKTASTALSNKIEQKKGKGTKLPDQTQTKMEHSFGRKLDDVSIHTDQDANKMNQELGAQAFTTGKDIYFNAGKFRPETSEGQRLIAHELTHVVQQNKDTVQKTAKATPSPVQHQGKYNKNESSEIIGEE